MQSDYPACFERDMGCTETEWLGWLQAARGAVTWQLGSGCAQATWPDGSLRIEWRQQAPRSIALMRIPRLWVRFEFSGLTQQARLQFMKRFDLYMQRGGG